MMNFLDLSAASEDERQLIKEMLADTSVVNFAEPLRQQFQQQLDQQQRLQSQQNQNHNHNKQQPHHAIKAKLTQNQHHDHTIPPVQKASNSHHVYNNDNTSIEQDNQHHREHHPVPHPGMPTADPTISNNIAPMPLTLTSAPSSSVPIETLNTHNAQTNSTPVTNHLEHNHAYGNISNNIRDNYHTNNINNVASIKAQAYQLATPSETSHVAPPAASTNFSGKNTLTAIQTSSPSASLTTSNVTQSTSTVPPQTIANQMPPQMAGDINPVIGIDMASTQPQGYAMPAPPSHVTAFGPAPPPPPHHVYGGPPIFQPTYTHYIFPYNLPYAMPYPVLPPTNSVVPNRQPNTPQTNQNQNNAMSNNSHSRQHSHQPRPNKLKDFPKHIQHHQQHHLHQHHQQMHHSQYSHQGYKTNAHTDSHLMRANDISERVDSYVNYQKNDQRPEAPSEAKLVDDLPSEPSDKLYDQQQRVPKDVETGDSKKPSSDEETVKVSPDEGFETQSSLDVSKQSHESSQEIVADNNTSSPEACSPEEDKPIQDNSDSNNEEKSQQNHDSKAAGPWGSASSKSWASLFKPDGTAYHGSSVDGDSEHNNPMTASSSNEDATNANQKVFTRSEGSLKPFNNVVSTKEQRSQDAARRALDKLAPKLAQKINSVSLKHSLPLLRPRGFLNKGNGCYINSTLQALIACPPFYNLMKEIGELRGIKRENSCTPILDSFAELFQNFPPLDASKKNKQQSPQMDQKLQMNYLQAEAIEPRCIYNVLGQIKSECLRGAQEDAEEFLSSVLNGLHEEMIGLSETLQSSQNNTSNHNGHLSDADDINGDSNNDENLWREVGPKNRSLPIRAATVINTPIQEIFGGSLFSIRTAGKDRCGHRSPFFDLQLDISSDNVKSLQDAIKSFTATEIIQDFYCSKTKQKLDAQRRTSLDQLPPILILHLKQFIYTQDHGLKKLMKRIEYPIDFELPEGCLHDKNSDKSLKNSRSYKLLAVVYHEGKEAVKGHYLTDVYHIGSSQWIRCDDSNLKVVPVPRIENPESSRTPYLLFYRRLNTLGPRQLNCHDNKKKS